MYRAMGAIVMEGYSTVHSFPWLSAIDDFVHVEKQRGTATNIMCCGVHGITTANTINT